MASNPKSGFTLIELSIVLVIIGLLAGGILVGRDLIKAANIRAQVKQMESMQAAFYTFATKYNGYAGDLPDATSFWPGTVNGNGNKVIETKNDAFYDSGSLWSEAIELQQFFVQMGKAELITGTYDGSAVLGKGMPTSVLNDKAGFFVASSKNFEVGGTGRNPDIKDKRRGVNAMWFVACGTDASGNSNNTMYYWDDDCAIFSAGDLQNIDIKLDDGLPLSGKLLGFGGHNSHNDCVTTPAVATEPAEYKIQGTMECQAAYVIN